MGRSTIALLTLLSTLALTLAGCGTDDESRPPVTTVKAPVQTATENSDDLEAEEVVSGDEGDEEDEEAGGEDRGTGHGKDKDKGKNEGKAKGQYKD
jgi:hypothetical protein